MELLGGLTPAHFLREHWQKKPLLVRQALPGFRGLLTPQELCRVAGRSDAVARTVREEKGRFVIDEGPFSGIDFKRLPRERFTLLVQALEQHLDGGWELLQRFSFIPSARVDDLMVSYAVPGAGVGPHFDHYDVFLLQGTGRRRWRISTDARLCTGDGRSLPAFAPTDDWVLEPGDMLYLPPRVAHWGTAVDACMTYSVGFLAPRHEQLVHNFLAYLGQEARPDGLYADPDLALQEHPAEVVDATVARVERALAELRWDRDRVGVFVGRLLTGPKPTTRFVRPRKPPDARAFATRIATGGVLRLARPSRMLFRQHTVFLNGEAFDVDARDVDALRTLADTRALSLPIACTASTVAQLHAWLRAGFVEVTAASAAQGP